MTRGEDKANPYESPNSAHGDREPRVPLWRVSTFGFYVFTLVWMTVAAAITGLIILLFHM